MTLHKAEENGKVTIRVEGWLDVETTPELHAFMEALPVSEELYFDFSELEYISSMRNESNISLTVIGESC